VAIQTTTVYRSRSAYSAHQISQPSPGTSSQWTIATTTTALAVVVNPVTNSGESELRQVGYRALTAESVIKYRAVRFDFRARLAWYNRTGPGKKMRIFLTFIIQFLGVFLVFLVIFLVVGNRLGDPLF